jgi:hypothetical protein
MVREAGARIRVGRRPRVGRSLRCGLRHPNGARLAHAAGGFPRSIDRVDVFWRRNPGGVWASWRSGSLFAGTLAGVAATAIGAVISVIGAAGLLAIWHDADTMAAIRASGGLSEVFELPIMMILPGAVVGTVGGVVGATIKRLRPA